MFPDGFQSGTASDTQESKKSPLKLFGAENQGNLVVRFGKYQGVQNASEIRIELQREPVSFFGEVSLKNFRDEGKVIPRV